jgi:hypothetical protein
MFREDDIKKLITEHLRRLQKLKEQEATFGINTPAEIRLDIENIEKKIEQLEAELEDLHLKPKQSVPVLRHGDIAKNADAPVRQQTNRILFGAVVLVVIVVIVSIGVALSLPKKPSCPYPYQADINDDTMRRLIQAESDATLNEDMSIIRAIFAEDAPIRDVAGNKLWPNPIDRYEKDLFVNTNFISLSHANFQSKGIATDRNIAWATTASQGSFVTPGGNPYSFNNPPGSDHWTFGQNSSGCWVITELSFNASAIPFP